MCYVTHDYLSDSSRTRDCPEDQHKFCNGPGIFTGFSAKGSSDSDWAKSPTSPLDIKTFSGIELTDSHENGLDLQSSSPKQHSETIPIGSPREFTKSHTCVISRGSKSGTNNLYTHSSMEREIVQYPLQKQNGQEIWDVASPLWRYSSVPAFSVGHFLRACCLCKRQLNHGKDIYMYRGDKAFCGVECRYQQILMDDVDGVLLPTDFDG